MYFFINNIINNDENLAFLDQRKYQADIYPLHLEAFDAAVATEDGQALRRARHNGSSAARQGHSRPNEQELIMRNNYLMIYVVCATVAIPLIWKFLPKKGNSNLAERIEVVKRFICIFGQSIIMDLAADREFVGNEWFKWLDDQKIPFSIRIKKNAKVDSSKGNNLHVRRLFINSRRGQARFLNKKKDIFGMFLWLAATRAQDGERVIVTTNHEHENALIRYKLRWNIETLFGFLKSKGFNFEDTHITIDDRLHNLLSELTLSFCLAYKMGQILAKEVPIKNKKHGRPEKSI